LCERKVGVFIEGKVGRKKLKLYWKCKVTFILKQFFLAKVTLILKRREYYLTLSIIVWDLGRFKMLNVLQESFYLHVIRLKTRD